MGSNHPARGPQTARSFDPELLLTVAADDVARNADTPAAGRSARVIERTGRL